MAENDRTGITKLGCVQGFQLYFACENRMYESSFTLRNACPIFTCWWRQSVWHRDMKASVSDQHSVLKLCAKFLGEAFYGLP